MCVAALHKIISLVFVLNIYESSLIGFSSWLIVLIVSFPLILAAIYVSSNISMYLNTVSGLIIVYSGFVPVITRLILNFIFLIFASMFKACSLNSVLFPKLCSYDERDRTHRIQKRGFTCFIIVSYLIGQRSIKLFFLLYFL